MTTYQAGDQVRIANLDRNLTNPLTVINTMPIFGYVFVHNKVLNKYYLYQPRQLVKD